MDEMEIKKELLKNLMGKMDDMSAKKFKKKKEEEEEETGMEPLLMIEISKGR